MLHPKFFPHRGFDHVILHCMFIRAFLFTFGTVFLIAGNGQMILLLVFLQQLLHQKVSFTFITWRHQVLSSDVLVNILLGCEPSTTVATGRCFMSVSHVPLQLRPGKAPSCHKQHKAHEAARDLSSCALPTDPQEASCHIWDSWSNAWPQCDLQGHFCWKSSCRMDNSMLPLSLLHLPQPPWSHLQIWEETLPKLSLRADQSWHVSLRNFLIQMVSHEYGAAWILFFKDFITALMPSFAPMSSLLMTRTFLAHS